MAKAGQRASRKKKTERVPHEYDTQRPVHLAQHFATLGHVVEGVVHGLDNVLLPLRLRLSVLLRAHATVDGPTFEHLSAVQGLVNQLSDMVHNLTLFSRDPERGGGADHRRIMLVFDVPRGLPPVAISPHRLTQTVLKLVSNARVAIVDRMCQDARREAQTQHGSAGGRIEIRAEADEANELVRLQIIDDGCGMSPEVKRHCLEPFFATKDLPSSVDDSGRDLGLALVQAICERSGGTLDIESELGKGTTVTMSLPIAKGPSIGENALTTTPSKT